MKLPRFLWLGPAAVAALGLAACSDSSQPAPAAPLPVSTVLAKYSQTITTASLTGVVQAQVEQSAAFRTGGRVIEVMVGVGDHVTAGQPLARLDDSEQQANLQAAQAAVRSAEAARDQQQKDFDRIEALFNQGNTTRAQLDAAQSARDAASSALDAANAQLSSAQELVSYVELTAEAAGIVLTRDIEVGQVVGAGQPVFTLAGDGARDAVFNVYEQGVDLVPKDAPVQLTLVADPAVTATGHVREIAPTVDPSNGTVRFKVGFDDPDDTMPLGASVRATTDLPPIEGVSLPWSALSRNEAGPAVWVVDPATNAVSLKAVTVNRYLDNAVLISGGLPDGTRVVVTGTQLLYPGETVAAKDVTP